VKKIHTPIINFRFTKVKRCVMIFWRISKEIFMGNKEIKTKMAYFGIVGVMLAWGIEPLFATRFLHYFSGTIYSSIIGFISAIALTLIFFKRLKTMTIDYLKIALPTGIFYALAALLQTIGLQYTTPTQYIFLENLSCLVVPFLSWILIKRKPSIFKIFAAVICLGSSFILSGLDFSSGRISFGVGEISCGMAGILYGANIAITGAYAKRLSPALYVMIHSWARGVISLILAFVLHGIGLEMIKLPTIPWLYPIVCVYVLIVITGCWIVRTGALKYVDASVVAVLMPLSAVVTSICSVVLGIEPLTINLVLGGGLGLAAVFLSVYGDIRESKKVDLRNRASEGESKLNGA
jgi:drug/metabolite transporter (DMT)-like permease